MGRWQWLGQVGQALRPPPTPPMGWARWQARGLRAADVTVGQEEAWSQDVTISCRASTSGVQEISVGRGALEAPALLLPGHCLLGPSTPWTWGKQAPSVGMSTPAHQLPPSPHALSPEEDTGLLVLQPAVSAWAGGMWSGEQTLPPQQRGSGGKRCLYARCVGVLGVKAGPSPVPFPRLTRRPRWAGMGGAAYRPGLPYGGAQHCSPGTTPFPPPHPPNSAL